MVPPCRVVFHIGQTKAGSTSIQNYLEAEREALLAQGILYPLSIMRRNNPFDQSRTAGHLLLLNALENAEVVEAFEQERAAHPHHTLVLSIENAFFDRPDSAVKALGSYLGDDTIEVCAVLRPQFDWLRSRYVENVLSGFSIRTDNFDHFVQDTMRQGVLDYYARLRHVAKLLGAAKAWAIPFTSDRGPLVTRFMQAADLPVTDPDAAASQHSNMREKSWLLVETKRRLNAICGGISLPLRLEIERDFRKLHASYAASSPEPAFCPKISLPAGQIARLERANRSLLSGDVMTQNLGLGYMGEVETIKPKAVSDLFRQGLRAAAAICDRHPAREALRGSLLRFTPEECDALVEALENVRVSSHLQAPETALLAACFDRRLVRLYLPPDRNFWRRTARLDGVTLQSPLAIRTTEAVADAGKPSSEALVVGDGSKLADIRQLLKQPTLRQVVLLEGARHLLDRLGLPPIYQRRDVGRCLFMTPQDQLRDVQPFHVLGDRKTGSVQ